MHSGVRALRIQSDLAQVADLMEIAFQNTFTALDFRNMSEMRWYARHKLLLWFIAQVGALQFSESGFVFEQDGRVVGHISLQPSPKEAKHWLIANVAVLPAYRRRGIARQLVDAALEKAFRAGAKVVSLQVDIANQSAIDLYRRAGFDIVATYTLWERNFYRELSQPIPYAKLHHTSWQELATIHKFLLTYRPNGLNWQETRPKNHTHRVNWLVQRLLAELLMGNEDWVSRQAHEIDGWMRLSLASSQPINLVIHPFFQEQLLPYFLHTAIRRLQRLQSQIQVQYPYQQGVLTFAEFNFFPRQHTHDMRLIL
jgi:ribosomal protein S18 acetylase RimI-like enzyme